MAVEGGVLVMTGELACVGADVGAKEVPGVPAGCEVGAAVGVTLEEPT